MRLFAPAFALIVALGLAGCALAQTPCAQISQCPAATLPLTGNEALLGVQNAKTVQVTTGSIANVLPTTPETANTFLGGPVVGPAAAPVYRALIGADLPNPSASTLGGVQSALPVIHQWVNGISTSGVPALSQPAFADVSGLGTAATQPISAFLQSANSLSDLSSFTAARANISLPVAATTFAGVDPTGGSDSTAGLVSALTAASGAELDIPCGTYLVSALAPPVNTRVIGTCLSGATTFKRLASAVQSAGTPLVTVASGDDLENFTVDLNSPAPTNSWSGIGPAGPTANVILKNLTVNNASFKGVVFSENAASLWTHTNLLVDTVTVNGSGWSGFDFQGGNGVRVINATLVSSGYDALSLENDTNVQLIGLRSDKTNMPPVIFNGAGNARASTSATSNTITNTGSLTFTVGTNLGYLAGGGVIIYETSAPANSMRANVTSYNSGTGALVVAPFASTGSGTHTDWNVVGEQGGLLTIDATVGIVQVSDAILNNNINAVGDGLTIGEVGTTSSTSITPGTGAKTFTIGSSGLEYFPGQEVSIFSVAGPTTTWMRGTVTSYSGTSLVTNITQAAGTGAHTDWRINTEPGQVTINNIVVTKAGNFGIDMASNYHLDHAVIDSSVGRALNLTYDTGGRFANATAYHVTIRNAQPIANGVGVFFGGGLNFTSYEHVHLGGVYVYDDRATPLMQWGMEVNDSTDTSVGALYADVTMDLNTYYGGTAQGMTSGNYNAFSSAGGGTDPRLGGAWATFAMTPVYGGGVPSGGSPSYTLSWDDHAAKTIAFSEFIQLPAALNGATTLTVGLPFTITGSANCTVVGNDNGAISTASVTFGLTNSGSATETIGANGGLTAGHLYQMSGVCQRQ